MMNRTHKLAQIFTTLLLVLMLLFGAALPAYAADDPLKPDDLKYEKGSDGEYNIILHKNARRIGPDEWEVEVRATVKDEPVAKQKVELVIVLDSSGSMAWCTDEVSHTHGDHEHTDDCYYTCGKVEHTHQTSPYYQESYNTCYTRCTPQTMPQHWPYGNYYHSGTGCTEVSSYNGTRYYYFTCTLEAHSHSAACGTSNDPQCGLIEANHSSSGGTTCKDENNRSLPTRLSAAKDAITQLTTNMSKDITVVGRIDFDSSARTVTSFGNNVTASGGTYMMEGIDLGIDQFSGKANATTGIKKVLVVVTDGESQDGYSSTKLTNFKQNGGTVYTVGFNHSHADLAGVAGGPSGKYVHASDTASLLSAMADIKQSITAMLEDPMGTSVGFDADSIKEIQASDGKVTTSGDTIYWNPDDDKVNVSNTTISYKYNVKLNENAGYDAKIYSGVKLNNPTYFRYGVIQNNTVTEMKQALFPIPEATYAISSVQVQWVASDGTVLKPATEVESVISDYEGTVETTGKYYTPEFTKTDYTTITETFPGPTTDSYYQYIGTTITANGTETATVDPTKHVAHVVTHNYVLVEPDSALITGTKEMQGREFRAGESYTFRLTRTTNNAPMPGGVNQNTVDVTVSALGGNELTFGFDPITYSLTGNNLSATYTYRLTEVAGTNEGVTYDNTVYTVTVNVERPDRWTTPTVTVTTNPTPVKFVNSYANGALVINKTLRTGTDVTTEGFTFHVTSSTVSTAELTAWAAANGYTMSGNAIVVPVTAENGKTVTTTIQGLPVGTYKVEEVNIPSAYSVTYTTANEVQVTAGATSTVSVTNSSTGTLIVTKDIVNGDTKKTFEFVVTDADGNEVTDGDFELTDNGTKTITLPAGKYTVTETTLPGYTPSVSVNGADALENTSTAEVTVLAGGEVTAAFTNKYEATGELELSVKKIMEGRTFKNGENFTFVVQENVMGGEPPVSKSLTLYPAEADGYEISGTFDPITYTLSDVGTHRYYVFELEPEGAVDGKLNGVTYDETFKIVQVEVKDKGDGTLSVTSQDSYEIEFTNKYDATGELELRFNKSMAGRNFKIDETFTFELVEELVENNKALQKKTLTVDANAVSTNVLPGVFDTIHYTLSDVGTHKYVMREVNPDGTVGGKYNGVIYDEKQPIFTVTVEDNGNGTLKVTNGFDGDMKFTNTYEATGTATIGGTKVLEGRALNEGEFKFYISAMTENTPMPENMDGVQNDADGNFAFAPINYTAEHVGNTYKYLIVEYPGNLDGVTYDTTTETVKVTVTDNGDGTLSTSITYDVDEGEEGDEGAVFTNVYTPKPVQVGIQTAKNMQGRDYQKGDEFDFTIYHRGSETEQPLPTATDAHITPTSGNKATVDFGEFEFSEPGTYNYTINELVPETPLGGVTYDAGSVDVTVHVTKNEVTGELSYTVEYGTAENKQTEFTNIYNATGSLPVSGTKTLIGRALEKDEFHFKLEGSEGAPMPADAADVTVSNKADGTFAFGSIEYTSADVGKEYTYTITEVVPEGVTVEKPTKDGVTYDAAPKTFTVKVLDEVKDGELELVVNNGQADVASIAKFINKYDATGELDIPGTKVLEGRALKEGETFTFTISGSAGAPMPAETEVSSTGSFTFENIPFTQADVGKEYTYTIAEKMPEGVVDGKLNGVTYDTHKETVTVTVADNGDGTLTVTRTYDADGVKFTNKYKPEPVRVGIQSAKNMQGREYQAGDEFTFRLDHGGPNTMQPIPTSYASINPTSGNRAEFSFGDALYTKPGTYVYTIKEERGKLGGVTYDNSIVNVTVNVTEDVATGTLSATVTYQGVDDPEKTEFTNTYAATGTLDISGTKEFTGRDLLKDETFTFTISGSEGAPMPAETEVSSTGSFTFKDIPFTQADVGKEYTYTIAEKMPEGVVDGKLNGVTYDTHKETVTVTVADNGDGKLTVTPTYDADGVTFTNSYKAQPAVKGLAFVKRMDGRAYQMGDEFTFEVYPSITDNSYASDVENVTITPTSGTEAAVDFGDITFHKEGTYEFMVNEMMGELPGVTYDEKNIIARFVVEDDGKGEMIVTGPTFYTYTANGEWEETDDNVFVNTYEASTTLDIEGTKEFIGRELLEGETFTFTISGSPGAPMPEVTETTIGDGMFSFGPIDFTLADVGKRHIYTIREVLPEGVNEQNPTKDGITYDTHAGTVTVTVEDCGDGNLFARRRSEMPGVKFTNVYAAEGTATAVISATKVLDGRELNEGEFTFQLKAKDAELTVLQEKTNAQNGEVLFDVLEYTEPGEYLYTINEVKPEPALGGVTYDETSETVKVIVTDMLNGKLSAEVVYDDTDDEGAVFTNVYAVQPGAKTEASIVATKVLTGREEALKSGEFSFTLADREGKKTTVTNDADGKVDFGTFTFDAIGEYVYTITEDAGNVPGVIYDTHIETVTIKVEDDLMGGLKATVEYDEDGAVFTNAYTASGTYQPVVYKKLTGRDLVKGEFSFTIEGKKGNEPLPEKITVTNDGAQVVFPEIEFTLSPTDTKYEYIITENVPEGAERVDGKYVKDGVTYDPDPVSFIVVVEDDGKGNLTASASYEGSDNVFENVYTPTAITGTAFEANKVLEGRAAALEKGEFTFELKDAQGKVLETVTNAADGTVTFAPIEYTVKGTYTYTITEKLGDLSYVTYDPHTITVTVEVTDDGKGNLTAGKPEYTGDTTFTNVYKPAPVTLTPVGQKVLFTPGTERELQADEFTFMLYDVTNQKQVEQVTNNANGSIPFSELTFTKPGTYTYTVSEALGTLGGMTYDNGVVMITVTVTDNNDGTLSAKAEYTKVTGSGYALAAQTNARFVNVYSAEGDFPPNFHKELQGRDLNAGEFTFVLQEMVNGEPGKVLQTVTNTADGVVDFENIEFTAVGVYEYVVKEVIPADADKLGGVTYDPVEWDLKVTVYDNGEGKLIAVPEPADGLYFTNYYEAEGELELSGTKTLTGRPENLKAGEFSFVLMEGDKEIATVSNDKNGGFTFETIRYELDDVGEHTYTIAEVKGNVPGVTYDETSYELTIEVKDNGDGTLSVTDKPEDFSADFENTYSASQTSVKLEASKVLEGRELEDGEFEFGLSGIDGAPMPEDTSAANAADGGFSFDTITYDKAGTYEYTITEVVPADADKLPGVTYDATAHTVVVTVEDNSEGALVATVTYDGETAAPVFTNTYKASPVDVYLAVTKELNGRDLAEGEFEFELWDAQDSLIETVKNEADGSVTFGNLTFTEAGTYEYTISEVKPEPALGGVTYDESTANVVITVTDNTTAGILEAEVTYSGETSYTFINEYGIVKGATAVISSEKELLAETGRKLKAGEFSFVLMEGDKEIATVYNDENGSITFPEIEYTEAGTYTYTISEVDGGLDYMTYATNTVTVTIKVVDNGDGTLTALEPEYEGENKFVNTYKTESTKLALEAEKVLEGRDLEAGEFEFVLEGEGIEETVTNAADGSIVFTEIEYDKVGTYTYTINEVVPADADKLPSVFYDNHTETVTVKVEDNEDGTLTATAEYSGGKDKAVFENAYLPTAAGVPIVTKAITGRDIQEGEFTFELVEVATGKVLQRKTNDADGKVRFDELVFDTEGNYTYEVQLSIREVENNRPSVTYDKHVAKVTMAVVKGEDGKLVAKPLYSDGSLEFVNEYNATGTLEIPGTKRLTGRDIEDGEFTFVVTENGKVVAEAECAENGSFTFTIDYEETDVGTHNYVISEVDGGLGGVDYDNTTYEVTVVATDNATGKLTVETILPEGGITFSNTYEPADTEAVIEATKVLNGRDLADGEFAFVLIDAEGNEIETVNNEADGSITFSAIPYTEVGTYTYTIVETEGELPGVTYDEGSVEVTVEVIDNLKGELVATVTYGDKTEFVNSYEASDTEIELNVNKVLDGRDLRDGEFTFELKDEDGETIDTAKNDAEGNVSFVIDYTEAGVYEYTITEVEGSLGGVEYTDHVVHVTVTVTDNTATGELEAEADYAEDTTFTNLYTMQPLTDKPLGGYKVMEGDPFTLKGEDFTFELKDESGEVIRTAVNSADGSFTFEAITYDKPGTYKYTISEVIPEDAVDNKLSGITYTTETVSVIVEVQDTGNGTMRALVSYDPARATFVNTYEADPVTTEALIVSKVLEGRDLVEGDFDFVLADEEGNEIERVANAKDGTVTFKGLEFTEPGVYRYTITEPVPQTRAADHAGVVYDKHAVNVTITVVDNEKGQLVATVETEGSLVFTNYYSASGDWPPVFTKVLKNRELDEGEFTFVIEDADHKELERVTNGADGSIDFSDLHFTAEGTYTYYVYEVKPEDGGIAGVTYDDHVITLTMTVTDNLDGTMTMVPSYDGAFTFTNVYEAEGQAIILGGKSLTGRDLNEGEFTFELWENGEKLAEATNTAGGRFRFVTDYTYEDLGKHTYEIREVKGSLGGVSYDEHVETVEVEVTDNFDGTLTADVLTSEDDIHFENAYAPASVKVDFEATKTLNGRDLAEGEFEFELRDAEGSLIETVKNAADGSISFTTIEYTEAGTYTYTIREVNGGLGGIAYDDHVVTVTVEVTDDLKGQLVTNVTYDASTEFINEYSTEPTDATLKVTKELVGRELKEGEFTFELRDEQGEVIQTAKNAADGTVSFEAITYTDDGEWTYTITEINEGLGGVEYDDGEVTATVTVTDDGYGTLTAEVTYGEKTVFTNTYSVEAITAEAFAAVKVLTGRDLNEGEFEFVLKQGEEVLQTVVNNGTSVNFEAIEYTAAGTYEYTISEVKGSLGGVTYDETIVNVTVKVTDMLDGTMTTEVSYDREAVFTNSYEPADVTAESLEVNKVLTGREMDEGEFTFELKPVTEGAPMPEPAAAVNTREGKVTFAPITYTEAGTYEYTISEVAGERGGVAYTDKVLTVRVTVVDNLDGTMTATNEYIGEGEDKTTFTNVYTTEPTEATLEVLKVLEGRDLVEGEFFFQLADAQGVVQQKANAADGKVVFDTIPYDAVGEYKYTITEIVPDPVLGGVTYDTHEVIATVTVTDDLNGKLVAAVAYEGDTTFTNTYQPDPVTADVLKVSKMLVGRNLHEGEFSFELKDAEGNTLQTKVNAPGGEVLFDQIEYTEPGEYFYTINEVKPEPALGGVTYDEHVLNVKVVVVDNLDGTMTATITYDGAQVFTNIYNAKGDIQLVAAKTLSGRALKNGEFSFLLKDAQGAVMQTVTNTADGAVYFTPIEYNVPGEYKYTINELVPETPLGGVTYDEHVTNVTVTVTDNEDGTLKCEAVYEGDVTFANVYKADGSLDLSAVKTVLGEEPAEGEVFDFVITDEEGNVVQTVNNAGSTITFEPLNYTELDANKTYVYTVTESAAAGWRTDARAYTVTVTVTDGGEGKMIVEHTITEGETAVETMAFDNSPRSGLTITKTVVGWESQKEFVFKVNLTDENDVPLTDAFPVNGADVETIRDGEVLKLKHGGMAVITEVPTGTKFTVEEMADKVYTTTISGVESTKAQGVILRTGSRVEFVNTVNTIDFSVTKEWDGIEGNDIELTLYADGVEMDPQPGYSRDGYVYTFSNLPKYTDEGELVVYAAKERYMDGYMTIYRNVEPWKDETTMIYNGGTIINRSVVEFSVQKIWSGLASYHKRPDIELILYCNGDIINRPTPKPDKNGWYHYYNLPMFYKGERAVYYVVEVPMPGYTTIYNGKESATCAYDGQTIENIKPPATADHSNVALWSIMALSSAGALLLLKRKRKNA